MSDTIKPVSVEPAALPPRTLLDRIRSWRTARKLRNGQCETCRGILPDNGYRWCSDECHDSYWESTAV